MFEEFRESPAANDVCRRLLGIDLATISDWSAFTASAHRAQEKYTDESDFITQAKQMCLESDADSPLIIAILHVMGHNEIGYELLKEHETEFTRLFIPSSEELERVRAACYLRFLDDL